MGGIILAGASLLIWIYLVFGRGLFWRVTERDDSLFPDEASRLPEGPALVVIIPARNEAKTIATTVTSLLKQTYPHCFGIVVVDDQSTDGTGMIAAAAARAALADDRLTVVDGTAPPAGWTGKLWALQQGLEHVEASPVPPEFVLFTDADIAYAAPDVIDHLVQRTLARNAVLTSLMVKLRCKSLAERLLAPAFVFFFQKLYPFPWVNDPQRSTAAAAGGCMLVHRRSLMVIGGLQAIRHALIDDCALGALMKRQGPIWLGLTERVHSLRPYPHFRDFRRMVTRSAYAELRYSPLRLVGAVIGMSVTYLAPPLLSLFGTGATQVSGAAAWALMAAAFMPCLRLYGRSPAWSVALPLIAGIYTVFTLDSALQHWRGRSGEWKGRVHAATGASRSAVVP
jgi:hopene-associated glycosyltransferase HpnB